MFRLQNNVPEVYVEMSRDFQIFLRVYDSIINSSKYYIDSMMGVNSAKECPRELSILLAHKVGFFTSNDTDLDVVSKISEVFPIIIRNKGSYTAIKYCVTLFQRVSLLVDVSVQIDIDNYNKSIIVSFSKDVYQNRLLFELMSYVLPTGYKIEYHVMLTNVLEPDNILTSDEVTIRKQSDATGSNTPPEVSDISVGSYSLGSSTLLE